MAEEEGSMERFDKFMRAIVAVPKKEALRTMKETLARKRRRARTRKKR